MNTRPPLPLCPNIKHDLMCWYFGQGMFISVAYAEYIRYTANEKAEWDKQWEYEFYLKPLKKSWDK